MDATIIIKLHPWNIPPKEAIQIQKNLARKVISEDRFDKVHTVAGVDCSIDKKNSQIYAAVVMLSFPGLKLLHQSVSMVPLTYPYIPGLLSFREAPVILEALEKLKALPDLLLCDGQGIAHQRRLGIASHIGVLTNLPSIGVAKKRLIGEHDTVPEKKGQWTELYDHEKVIGAVLRTRDRVKPLYISIGHKISLPTAIRFVFACTTRYRLPETTRYAHRLAGEISAGNIEV